jgi:apolipoprotein N-acyltransferase
VRQASVRSYLQSAAAGVALAVALPGPGLWPLAFLVPGLLRRALAGRRGWAAFRLGWAGGLAQWIAAVPWVVIVLHRHGHLALALSVVAMLLMSAILGLQWGIAVWGASRVPPSWRLWGLPLCLVAVEQLQRFPPWIFPWNPVAAVATAVPALMLPLPVLGAAGLSLLLLLAGSALDELAARRWRSGGAAASIAFAAFTCAVALAPPFRSAGGAVRVAALQPNVPLEFRWDAANLAAIEGRVWRLNLEATQRGAKWIVWPESAIPRYVERDAEYRAALEDLARRHSVWLLVGSIGFGRAPGEYYNSVFSVSPGGLVPWRYDKVHLVPFGEYVPLAGRFAVLRPLVREVGSFTHGMSTLPLPGPAGAVGVAVCYEVTFPELIAQETANGARVLATITNDGWYGASAAPRQHLALAQLRAAESRRYLVRAANTGISAVIDPYGRLVATLGLDREGFVDADVYPGEGVTPAVRWGGAVSIGMVALALAAILLARRRLQPPAGAAASDEE